jgi:hypothetical protein
LSIGLRWLMRDASRPAPLGARPPRLRTDMPPDGWEALKLTPAQSLGASIDSGLLRAADGVARSISRRVFLRRAGQLGLLLGLAVTDVLWFSPSAQALTCNFFDGSNDKFPGACGPSEPCGGSQCNSSDNCDTKVQCSGGGHLQKQPWASATCGTGDNSWSENCCSQNGFHWSCHDCCGCTANISGQCDFASCGNHTRYRCICRHQGSAC